MGDLRRKGRSALTPPYIVNIVMGFISLSVYPSIHISTDVLKIEAEYTAEYNTASVHLPTLRIATSLIKTGLICFRFPIFTKF